jgi:Arc/MetJ-type ribon-helix-helix transcriptional regulator
MDLPPHFTAPSFDRAVQRVNVNFSEQAYQTLQDLANRSGKSMSDVLREAIALKAWFDKERAEGSRILVERPNGQVREVISV